jgi:cytochrome c oxidase subunit II
MLAGSAVIFSIVVALLAVGLLRRRGADGDRGTKQRAGMWFVAAGGVIVPMIVLAILFAFTVGTLPTTSAAGQKTDFAIDVVARQWFWDVDYPAAGVRTANEIHLPVGASALVRVTSDDVIHSLWVPELNRKIDAIPGRRNGVVWHPTRTGVFRGQCAEFCGIQHANMALYVVVESQARYEAWLAEQARPAPQPATDELARGQQIFLGSACEYCHRIAGTNASGTIGPDLTHLASRLALAAGTIPNNPGDLAGWILDPQHVKPGNRMPGTALTGSELQSLLAYLESLR